MKYKQIGFFDTENRYEKLTQIGDPLELHVFFKAKSE